MSPALMRDLRTRVHGTRSMERLSDLETDKRPNLILSGRRSGSFVKQRQEAFISDFGDHNPFSASTGDINRSSSSSVNLPRIPSKTLKERGIIHVTKRTDVIRSGDVKRPASTVAGQEEEERYQAQKRRTKGGKHAKRKLTPTQVTKYEGSVKTVRRQIKPGHVEELREIFKKQSEQDEDAAVPRHGKRRMTSHRNGSSNDDDDSGSGYTTTSSDNEPVHDDSTSGAASFDFQGLNSSDSVTVETDHVDVAKAKEVISAFFAESADRSQSQGQGRLAQGEGVRGESSIDFTNAQHGMTSQSAHYDVMAGNVGVGAGETSADQSYGNASHAFNASGRWSETEGRETDVRRSDSGTYVSKVNVFRSDSDVTRQPQVQQFSSSASWERRKEDERSLDNSLYKIEKVSSAEDWAEKQGGRTVYRTVDSVHTSRKSGDENNNIRAYRLVHTLPSDKTVTDDGARYRASEVTAFHRSPSPAGKGFSRFDDDVSYRTRSVSPSRPPRGRSPTPPGKHRTVITLQVNKQQKTPTQQYADTDQGTAQYRVVNVRSGDDSQYSPSSQPTSGSSYYAAHNQSFPSPVSGYESDMERSTTTTSRVYNVNTSRPPRPASPAYDNYPTAADRRYVVQKTKPSSGQAVVEEERVTLREIKPRVSSPPPSVTHRSSGEWHKTTIDINRNVSTERTSQRNMAPLHQQKHKSYVVFNSMDNVRDTSRDVTSPPHPLQRSTSQTMSSDRHFRVTSPTPTSGPFQRSFRQDIFVESGRGGQRMTLPPRRERVEDETDTYRREVYEEKSYEMRSGTTNVMPEADQSQQDKDLRVLRGKILIQNRLDDSRDHDDFLDNMNVFDSSFHLGKDNPLYQSDPDIYRSLEAELQREDGQRIGQEVTQDITFEKVDKIAQRHKAGEVQLSPKPRKKQTLSALLLSKLANIDSKDIRQHIDVQHHNEEIYGDVALVHADGTRAHNANTSTFDSVNENVELMLKEGKAFVIIKVIAERIVPIDWEFNVWRKSQAIVTRNIEIDLKATEQRRRLYEHVMETAGHRGALEDSRGAGHYRQGDASSRLTAEDHERQLSSLETLRLFSQILEVADGKGEVDDTEMRTEQEMGMLPGPQSPSAMDLLY
nr:hypothetical protein BaRGS_019514 [Batillaria attramentaria]